MNAAGARGIRTYDRRHEERTLIPAVLRLSARQTTWIHTQ